MVNKTINHLQQRSGESMATSSRRILRPTICSVSNGSLAVTPVVFREIMSKKKLVASIKTAQISGGYDETDIHSVLAQSKNVWSMNRKRSVRDYEDLSEQAQSIAEKSSADVTSEQGHSCSSLDYYYGEKCYSSYSFKMTRRIRPLEIRGISKSSIDSLQPLPERPEEQVRLAYYGKLPSTKQDSLDASDFEYRGLESPLPLDKESECLRESLDSSRDQSELSDSNTWSVCTGNLTGRSSVYSWGNDDEFDRQASATVRQMFDEIDELLFEENESKENDPLTLECKEWSTNFHHMRVVGSQLLSPDDTGTQFIVTSEKDRVGPYMRPDTAITAISLDDVTAETLAATFNGLSLSGQRIEPAIPPSMHSSINSEDNHSNPYSHLEEEIYAADGDLEEYFAYDTEFVEPWDTAKDERKSKRNKQCGYPPVTPHASATDSLISEAFDRLWIEAVQSLRALLLLFTERSSGEYAKSLLPAQVRQSENSSVRTFSRDSSFRTGNFSSQFGFKSFYGAPPHISDAMGLNELMLIRSLSLRHRDSTASTMAPRDEDYSAPMSSHEQFRPVSSNFPITKGFHNNIGMHQSDHQLYGKMATAKAYKRSGRLQPLQPMDRIKTPGTLDNDVIGEMVIGTRLHTAGDHRAPINNLPAFSPQLWGAKNGALPPIERPDSAETLSSLAKDQTRSPKQRQHVFNKRASSAATNETRRTSHREKVAVFPDSRPNTTHTFRSDTPASETAKRLQTQEKTSNLSTGNHFPTSASEPNENSIGMIQGVSLALGTHHQSTKTVSFEEDVEEFNNFATWGSGTPLLHQHHQKRRRTNVR
ncbi:protein FAM149B1-like isoform X2 [Rhopilema esculentum]|uniref:protein FAM149B1-like isoform X2 n=1 Tax=Rhopilema esculentum TaxID=499914 RepID=UPI0031DB2234